MTDAFIYDAVRTPRGRGKTVGSLHEVPPVRLAAHTLRTLRDRTDLETGLVDDVILGVVSPIGEQGADIARIAVLHADWDESVAGVQINRFCASGLEAVNMAAAKVMSGQSAAVVGGGVESMSRVPIQSDGGAWAADPQVAFQTYFVPQGVSADLIATKYGYSRSDADALAVRSQKLAGEATEKGYFKNSMAPVYDQTGALLLDYDELQRPQTTLEDLAQLTPSFEKMGKEMGFDSVAIQRYPEVEKIHHIHHPGNSSGIVDGAAAVLIGNREFSSAFGRKPRARIRAFATSGSEPAIMLTGPAPATEKALKLAGMSITDIDLFEVNEAFASVVLRFMDVLDVPIDKVNVNGGSIAMGHPLGATGALLIATVLDELERRNLATGLVTLCVGAGMGIATIIERV